MAAWAAEQDAKHAEKLPIEKDQKLLREGREKKSVDGQDVKKDDAKADDKKEEKKADAKAEEKK